MGIDVAKLRAVAFAGDEAQAVPVTRRALREIVRQLEAQRQGGAPA